MTETPEAPPTQPQAPPMMDALAALRCWAVQAVLPIDGQDVLFRIEAAPAADWLIATLEEGHLSYLPGMLDDVQRDLLMEALADGTLSTTDLRDANREILEQASGWRWWQAARLIGTLRQSWATLGFMLLSNGIDPGKQSLGAVLGAVYGTLWQNAGTKEDRDKLTRQVLMPPVADMPDGEWDDDAAHDALWQMLAAASQGRATS